MLVKWNKTSNCACPIDTVCFSEKEVCFYRGTEAECHLRFPTTNWTQPLSKVMCPACYQEILMTSDPLLTDTRGSKQLYVQDIDLAGSWLKVSRHTDGRYCLRGAKVLFITSQISDLRLYTHLFRDLSWLEAEEKRYKRSLYHKVLVSLKAAKWYCAHELAALNRQLGKKGLLRPEYSQGATGKYLISQLEEAMK